MSSQKTSQDDAAGQGAPTGAGDGPAGGQEADGQGNPHAIAQAARAVMHPEKHDLEWRFYHGATHG